MGARRDISECMSIGRVWNLNFVVSIRRISDF
ncbi:hypothetical protein BDI4_740063 [Burkholderia diffusa]|nr:hypothetical protein BDI4_740063 [Burkholderia diffusa]